jgi:tRNA threonylcarbamoyl adenosine modification protein (Sua5/YciO/YrdC/YwlC family)
VSGAPSPAPATLAVDLSRPESWRAALLQATAVLAGGEIAILPAEGLYGFHVRADLPPALARLQSVKPREPGRGWILLLAEPRLPAAWGASLESRAAALAAAHWPGPLTLVVPAPPGLPPELRAEDRTVAVRCPGSDFLRAVVAAAGGPLVSTSANRPGGRAPAAVGECAREGAALVVDGGTLSGIPSTLVRVYGSTVKVLRSGALKVEGEAP